MIYKEKWFTTWTDEDRPAKFHEFIDKFQALQLEYGYTLSHEDGQGSFEVWECLPTEDHFEWQRFARVCRHTTPEERENWHE